MSALLVPSFSLGMATAPVGDLVLIALLFVLSRLALAFAALDAGTGIASLAGQRDAALILAAAPAPFIAILLVAAATGTSLLDPAVASLRETAPHPALALAALAATIACLALGPRPEPDFAGSDLAVTTFAAQLECVTVLSLAAALLVPFGLAPAGSSPDAWLIGAACWAVKMAALGGVVAALRRARARLRPEQAPELALLGLLLALIAAALFFAGQGAA